MEQKENKELKLKINQDKQIQEELANKTESGGGASDPSAIGYHGHMEQFKDFIKAINKDTVPFIDGHEGRRSVEIILAIYKAAETGRSVELLADSAARQSVTSPRARCATSPITGRPLPGYARIARPLAELGHRRCHRRLAGTLQA